MTITLDVLVMLIGLLMFILSASGKVSEIGRIMFAFGLLALLLGADKVIALIKG